MFEFRLPDIGEGVVEGEVVKWHVKPGDSVREDQPMVEVMTDKATVEIPSPRAGVVAKIHVPEGKTCKVGQVMLQMGLNPQVVRGVQKTVGALALMDWKQGCAGRQWTIAEIIEEVYVRHALEITRREAPVETAHASLGELLNSLDTGKRQRDP